MVRISTNIDIQDSLYSDVCSVAEELRVSHDELLIIAVKDYLRRRKNQQLLQSINDAYADGLDASEEVMLEQMRRHQQQLFEQE